ncbi:biotin carboxyl carrier protein [Clostridia bacterium]|nr:biotin carboxyl carrier protein [Clostridia bacterium]
MKKYKITVNGAAYDVAVEELADHRAGSVAAPVSVAPAPAPALDAANDHHHRLPPCTARGVGEGVPVTAPMPGTIIDIMVRTGDEVEEGEPIVVLEALKMENNIAAAKSGVISSVQVSKGATVQTGDTIVTIATIAAAK